MNTSFKNTSGMALFTIIILTTILSVIVIGIMSLNVSQVKSSQTVIDELKAEYLAQGYFYRHHQEKITTGQALPLPTILFYSLDGKNFTLSSSNATGTYNTEQVDLNVGF